MFLYHLLKPFIFIFLRIYYRVSAKGLKNIPFGKPIILAPNHVNAFIDPIILASMLKQRVWFFARSDVFKNPAAKTILYDLNIRPMYRIQEGYSNLKNNNKTFEECKTLLSKNKTILMFPEGICIMENRLRKLKKGLSRIIFDTEDAFDFKKEVWVVPVGLNYSEANAFNSKLYVNIGKAIHISEYKDLYRVDKVKAINHFTHDLEDRMRDLLVVVNNPDNDELYTSLTEIYTAEKIYNSSKKSLDKEHEFNCALANAINHHNTNDLKEKTKDYINQLHKHKIADKLLYKSRIESLSVINVIGRMLLLVLGFPFFAIGILANYPPYYLAQQFADKKVKNIEFYASIYFAFSMIGWIVYYGIQLLVAALLLKNNLWLLAYTAIAAISGLISIKYYQLHKNIRAEQCLLQLTRTSPDIVTELLMKRQEIITLANDIVKH